MFVRGTTHNLFDLFLDVKYGMMVAVGVVSVLGGVIRIGGLWFHAERTNLTNA
jgi:hypothetical protein